MNLLQLRTEVTAHGFNFDGSRINNFINDGYLLACKRVNYFVDEATQDFSTVNGTTKYSLPANLAKVREVWDTGRSFVLTPVGLRDIDNSSSTQKGPPTWYALDGANVHLYPTPDGIYSLELRYWLLPTVLSADGDTPTIPAEWHHMLWEYAVAQCYWADDDAAMGQQWDNKFATSFAEFAADVKFPDTEYPSTAKSMWDTDSQLRQPGWSIWGWGW